MMVSLSKIFATFMTIFFSIFMMNAYSLDSENFNTNHNKISFYFQNIELKTLLQLIAKSSGLNFIVSDTVKGTLTLNLKNVTWHEALDIILKSNGLASRRIGSVIYISTIENITTNEMKQLKSEEDMANLAPLKSQMIRLKYANANEMASLLKGQKGQLLSKRGEVAIDARTNTLVIRDTEKTLMNVIPEIKKMDISPRQVLIEARIVKLDTDYEETLGIRFGLTKTDHLTGTFNAANQLVQGVQPANITNPAGIIDPTRRLNFNQPATSLPTLGGDPASIALALARIGPVLLDLELSALEGENHAKIIATPRVVTSNQEKAVIETGQEIPYQEATSSGATSITFKSAVLSLEVVPQITPDNKIILDIKATEDTPGNNIQTGEGGTTIPAINTQAVQSHVILNNNETVVLGGVYQMSKSNKVLRVPFLGSIPILGYFFRQTTEAVDKTELLIFLTPKIIEPHQSIKTVSNISRQRSYKGEF